MLKEIEELAEPGLGTANVAVITPKAIAGAIQEVARGECVYAQFYRSNRDLMGQGTPHEIGFPKKGTGISASWDVAQGQSIAATTFAYDATTIRVKKAGIRMQFHNEALEAAMRDVIADHIYEAGLVYAELLDDVAKTIMLDLATGYATVTTGSLTTFSTTTGPIITATPGTGTIKTGGIAFDTGVITLTGSLALDTVTVVYSGSSIAAASLWIRSATATTIVAKDILLARAKIIAQNRHPDVCIMNDEDIPNFLYDANVKWLDASFYGSREGLLNAEVGKLFGLRVVTTTRAPTGVAAVIDSSRLGYHVHKRDLKGVREDKPEYDQVWYHYWTEQNFGKTDNFSVGLVVRGHSLAA